MIQLLVQIGLIGLITYVITLIPMSVWFKRIIIVIGVAACLFMALSAFGFHFHDVAAPHLFH